MSDMSPITDASPVEPFDDYNDNISAMSPSSGTDEGLCEQLCNDMMTSSYTEISFDASDDEQTDVELAEEVSETDDSSRNTHRMLSKKLSSSLSLPQLSSTIVNWSERTKASYETEKLTENVDNSKEKRDFVAYDGHLVSFVAQDFEKKLKLSTSLSSIEGQTSRQSDHIDLKLLNNLEKQAKMLESNMNTMLRHISESSNNITSLTVECITTYENCLNKTCDVVDANIKMMYQLMAKCEELNQSMKPINKLSDELKEVKRLLDMFEKAVEYKL